MRDFVVDLLAPSLAAGAFITFIWFVSWASADDARNEWRDCRTLLAAGDSATIIAAKPECAKWTWPQPKEGR